MYTEDHKVWPYLHLKHGGWYLDCSKGYIPISEKPLYASLNAEAPSQMVVYEPLMQEESNKENSKASKAAKDAKELRARPSLHLQLFLLCKVLSIPALL
jgi:hypothetical protein